MDIKDFKAGSYKSGYEYRYFLPEKINHSYFWGYEAINELLEKASLKLPDIRYLLNNLGQCHCEE